MLAACRRTHAYWILNPGYPLFTRNRAGKRTLTVYTRHPKGTARTFNRRQNSVSPNGGAEWHAFNPLILVHPNWRGTQPLNSEGGAAQQQEPIFAFCSLPCSRRRCTLPAV